MPIVTGPSGDIRPMQLDDPIQQYGQMLQLRNAIQNAPLQRQALEQQVQAGQLGIQQQQMANQQAQQAQQDQQVFRTTMMDPSMQGKTIGDVADTLARQGKLSQAGWTNLKRADLEQKTALAGYDDKQLTNAAAAHKQTQDLYNNVMNLPDDVLAQQWPSIAQQYDAIPGNNKMPLDPNQPLSKQQLQQFGPMISMQEGYLANETAKRENAAKAQKANTDQQIAQQNLERGGTTDTDKFTSDYLKTNNLENTPANRQKAFAEYTRQTKIAPAMVRVEGIASSKEMPVIDTQNNNTLQYASAADINAANKATPGRFVPAVEGGKALNKTALIEDIRGNVSQVRDSLKNPKLPEFTADQRAQIAVALGNEHSQDAISSAFRGGVLGSLTPEQQDYLINMAQLKENAMAMRSVLGAGQGSQDLRDAILATLPGPRTPSKAFALQQLNRFENVLDRLGRGVATVPLKSPSGSLPTEGGGTKNDPLGIR